MSKLYSLLRTFCCRERRRPYRESVNMRSNRKSMSRVISVRRGKYLAAIAIFLVAFSGGTQAFELTSPDVKPDQPLPEKFTFSGLGCQGQKISPALSWTNPPEGAKSFALMVHDPDAVTGGAGVWHWVVINIPATARSIDRKSTRL